MNENPPNGAADIGPAAHLLNLGLFCLEYAESLHRAPSPSDEVGVLRALRQHCADRDGTLREIRAHADELLRQAHAAGVRLADAQSRLDAFSRACAAALDWGWSCRWSAPPRVKGRQRLTPQQEEAERERVMIRAGLQDGVAGIRALGVVLVAPQGITRAAADQDRPHEPKTRPVPAPTPEEPAPTPKAAGTPDSEAVAIAMLVKRPELTLRDIAKNLGVERRTVYRWKKFLKAAESLGKYTPKPKGRWDGNLPNGSKTRDGDLEAWRDDDHD